MASYNKCILMGNLTRDPQGKHTSGNTFIAEFGIACNRKFKTSGGEEREEVLFIDCAAFGKTGELINQYFTKGKPIFLDGRLKLDQWEDKKDGSNRSKISLVVDNFQFVGGRDDDGEPRQDSRPAPKQRRGPVQPPFGDEKQFEEADVPF